jgi:transposase InsO family protein
MDYKNYLSLPLPIEYLNYDFSFSTGFSNDKWPQKYWNTVVGLSFALRHLALKSEVQARAKRDDYPGTKAFAKMLGLITLTTPVESPQINGMVESFVKTLKRDYANLANRPDSRTVMGYLEGCFNDYNSYHPHSALGYLPTKLFREKKAVN